MGKLLTITTAILILSGAVRFDNAHAAEQSSSNHIAVYKTPWCGCCQVWVEALEKAGYSVNVTDMEDLSSIKQQASLPEELEACHTAIIGSDRKYVLEGHVPLEAIEKLMSAMPDVRGIATPGMPMGSLGMNYDPKAKYTVYGYSGNSEEKPTVFYEAGRQ